MDHPILLWLDGTHVSWFMCTRNLETDVMIFKSYKIVKSALSTQVLWNCAGEVQWVSNSYPTGTHDQGIMSMRCSSPEFSRICHVSQQTLCQHTHPNIITPEL